VKKLTSTIIVLLWSFGAIAQTRTYAVKVIGLKVGEIHVTKSQKLDSTIYNLTSKVDVNFLVYRLKVDYRVKSVYLNDRFERSEVKVVSNRGNYFTKTERVGNGYRVFSHQLEKKKINKTIELPIESTFAHLFFNEPGKLNNIYAEFYADFIELKDLKPNAYLGELDKNFDEYHFENGLLVKMVKKNPITDMVIEYLPPNKKSR
jgi:hypothetical protein